MLAGLLAWALLVHPQPGTGAVGGGGAGNTTFTTSTTHHDTHTRQDLPNAHVYLTRVLGLLFQSAPSGEVIVLDQSSPNPPASSEVSALFTAAFDALETAANDPGVLPGTCAALQIANPQRTAGGDSVGSAAKVDEELDYTETSVTTSTTLGPGTILIGEDQSEPFFVAAGTTNFNTNTHTERFITDFFQATVTHDGTYEVVGEKTVGPANEACHAPVEDCGNCLDDDADALVDRDDFACPPRADGAGAGLALAKPDGKAIAKCAAALRKGGGKFFATRLKHLQKCTAAAFACVQLKASDPACLAKAASTCTKDLAARTKDEVKLAATIQKACAVPVLTVPALLSDSGLGLLHEATRCAGHGVAALATVADLAACVARQHQCNAEHVLAFETPRAAELLTAVGRDAAIDAPCLPPAAAPGGGISDPVRAKQASKCARTVAKAGQKLAAGRQKLAQKCSAAVYACVQQKPGDAGCLAKAHAGCARALAKIAAPTSGLEAKFVTALAKACGTLPAGDLAGPDGLGFEARAAACNALAAGTVSDAADVARCLAVQHACRVRQVLELEQPRLDELLDLGQVSLP